MSDQPSLFPAVPDPDRDAFGHWLSGLTDGEGSFQLRIGFRTDRKLYDMGGSFAIGLRADDLPILKEIHEFFGCGHAYIAPGHDRRGDTKPSAHYKVYRAKDLMSVVVPHFVRYPLRAKKARDFVIWREGVELLHRVSQRRGVMRGYLLGTFPRWLPEELTRFQALTDDLKRQREYVPPPDLA